MMLSFSHALSAFIEKERSQRVHTNPGQLKYEHGSIVSLFPGVRRCTR